MGLLDQLASFVEDAAPAYAFELSGVGIAWTSRPQSAKESRQFGFRALEPGVLNVSPISDNVAQPDVLLHEVSALGTPTGKKKKDAVLILPDYCARVAVLDFESFPAAREEQLSLVRFRLKKTVPFDVDSAAVNFHAQKAGKMTEVVVAAASHEIIARYEAPFRANGFNPGFVTTSILASLDLLPAQGLQVLLKLAGRVLTVAVCDGRMPKLVRCVELPDLSVDEVKAVLFPTLAYAEDMLGRKPETLYAVGLGDAAAEATAEWGLPIHSLRSAWAAANETNSGLLGWLQAQEAA